MVLSFTGLFRIGIPVVLLLQSHPGAVALSLPAPKPSRRDFLAASFAACGGATFLATPASAFPNHVADYAKYTDKTKRRGTPPKDLGVELRTTEGLEDALQELAVVRRKSQLFQYDR